LYAALNDLGVVRESQDRAPDSIALLQEALTGRIRLFGQSDPLVLASMSNLSQAYDRAGKTEQSLQMLLDALRVGESLDQPPRMMLLELNNNIGATYQDLNRDRDAEPYVRKAAALATGFLGAEHPATLTIEANLAGIESELGAPEAAADRLARVVEVRTRTLGADAHDTLTGRYAYWNALWKAGRFTDAAAGLTALLADVDRALGERHWLAAATRTMLARVLVDGGQPQQALPYATQAAAQFAALYGPDHPRAKTAIELTQQIMQAASPLVGHSANADAEESASPDPQSPR
jgi:tetratricopeptide (TPR) repeat protein